MLRVQYEKQRGLYLSQRQIGYYARLLQLVGKKMIDVYMSLDKRDFPHKDRDFYGIAYGTKI